MSGSVRAGLSRGDTAPVPQRTVANPCASRPGQAKFSSSEMRIASDVNGVSHGD